MLDQYSRNHHCKRLMALLIACLIVPLFQKPYTAHLPSLNLWSSNGPNGSISSVVVDPIDQNIIYAVAGNLGVFKSMNNGASWSPSNGGLGKLGVGSLAIDPGSPNTLYAGTSNGVFKTINGGANWNLTNSPVVSVGYLAVAPNNSSIVYGATELNMLVTTNGGETWITRPFPVPLVSVSLLVVDPQNPNGLYIFVTDFDFFIGLYKSTDGGSSWARLFYSGGQFTVATFELKIDSSNPNILYAATYFGVYKSADGGASWMLRGSPGSNGATALAIDLHDPGTLYSGTYDAGVYKSTNDGVTWSAFNSGLTIQSIHGLAFNSSGSFLHAATSTGVFDVRVREDSGVNPIADFDGDGRSDISVFRPSDRVWYLNRSTQGFSATQFGLPIDKITPADFDGDGKTDIAVYRDGVWYWLNSSNSSFNAIQFGLADDVPVPSDFTGDGRAELAVYRGGVWWTFNLSNNQVSTIQFGLPTDKPVVADYDGDGRADQAVYRNGEWHLNRSTQGYAVVQFGLATDKPVVGDYDGDGKTDEAVYRNGTWYLLCSQTGLTSFQFGLASDIPASADFDGDGRTDAAVFRDGTWYLRQSTSGLSIQPFGLVNDKPVPSAFLQ